MKNVLLLTPVLLLLTACVSTEELADKYAYKSCWEIAKEMGRYENQKDKANDDRWSALVDKIDATKKEREKADRDELLASIDGDIADDYLQALQLASSRKGCGPNAYPGSRYSYQGQYPQYNGGYNNNYRRY